MAALPWGSSSSSTTLAGTARVDVKIIPFDTGSSSSFMGSLLGRTPRNHFKTTDGTTTAAAGVAYQIEIRLHERLANDAIRVVCASIAGHEINEQLIMRGSAQYPLKFVGWIDNSVAANDGTQTKRIKFTVPASGEAEIRVGVFEATAAPDGGGKGKGKDGGGRAAPSEAHGDGFIGPPVSNQRFVLGQPVAIGVARVRAAA